MIGLGKLLKQNAKTTEDIAFDWKEYGLENDSKMTKDAQELKHQLRKAKWVQVDDVEAWLDDAAKQIQKLTKNEPMKERKDSEPQDCSNCVYNDGGCRCEELMAASCIPTPRTEPREYISVKEVLAVLGGGEKK